MISPVNGQRQRHEMAEWLQSFSPTHFVTLALNDPIRARRDEMMRTQAANGIGEGA